MGHPLAPHWLLFGKKRRGSASDASGETGYAQGRDAAWGAGSAWGAGTGFYSSETDHPEWTDMTLRTLSEIDPDWAGHVVMDEEAAAEPPHAPDGYYDEAYEEPAAPARQEARPESGYWEETQDEIEAPPAAADAYAQALPYEDDDFYGTETSEALRAGIRSARGIRRRASIRRARGIRCARGIRRRTGIRSAHSI